MYFWNIRRLKSDLVERGLTEGQSMMYLLVLWVVSTLCAGVAAISPWNIWACLFWVGSTLILSLGVLYVYHRNGGAGGQQFLQRCLSLFWVCTVRWFVMLVIPTVIVLEAVVAATEPATDEPVFPPMTPTEAVWSVLVVLPLYWRVGVHIRDVAAGKPTSDTTSSDRSDSLLPLEPLED